MKEFDFSLFNIFSGLSSKRVNQKKEPVLLECHNLEPVDGDYILHELITDLNADKVAWDGLGIREDDRWVDHEGDDFIDDDADEFKDD